MNTFVCDPRDIFELNLFVEGWRDQGSYSGMITEADIYSESRILYVDDDAPVGGGGGASWANAFDNLQDALDVAQYGDEIRVGEGIYYPDPSGLGDSRTATFPLINGVTIKGGYAGYGAVDPDVRDPNNYLSVLCGDIGTADDNSDNCYHVVTGSNVDPNTLLDGLTITGGNANGAGPYESGGGLYINAGHPVVHHCVFENNNAWDLGGGIAVIDGGLTINGCTIRDNMTNNAGGGVSTRNSHLRFTDCTISDNQSGNFGGGGDFCRR